MSLANSFSVLQETLSDGLESVRRKITENLTTGITELDEPIGHVFSHNAKMLRGMLVLCCSSLKNSKLQSIDIAAAVELAHAATLIHDDIVDEAQLRRGRITVNRKWDSKIAVLSGDYLLSRALEMVVADNKMSLYPVMAQAVRELVTGELYEIQYANIARLTEEHYLKIIELKTARFMAACCKLGAMVGDLSPDEISSCYEFGFNMGMAFQITDDLLDFSDKSGKDLGKDFREGKLTLPGLFLLQSGAITESELSLMFDNPTEENWNQFLSLVSENGVMDLCLKKAVSYIKTGEEHLRNLPESKYTDLLLNLNNFVIERNF